MSRTTAIGITPARRAAYDVVRRTFEDDAWTDRAFTSAAARMELSGRQLAQSRRLAYGAVQRRGTADHLIEGLADRPVEAIDPGALAALRLGLYELLFADAAADHAAVDQAVELAKAGVRRDGAAAGEARAVAGFANAVLRRVAAERDALLASIADDSTPEAAAIAYSYPPWLVRTWWSELGADDAKALMRAMNEPAETAMRVNTLRAVPAELALALREAGVAVRGPGDGSLLSGTDCLLVDRAAEPVAARIETGELIPQSRGSQSVVAILDPRPGDRVLDVCAGPGIKTTQIAAKVGGSGSVRSVEIDAARASEIDRLCTRAGVGNVTVEVADAAEVDLGSGYDRILVDPPCSDLGTLASRPDARWRKSPETVLRLAQLQRRIVARAARALAPAGCLVYSTCTISAGENEEVAAAVPGYARDLVVDDLGARHPPLRLRSDRRFLQVRPERDRTTGFFIARYIRSS
jgi:16S rRNA (cytosine967-C5)-methyltransferase